MINFKILMNGNVFNPVNNLTKKILKLKKIWLPLKKKALTILHKDISQ